MTSHSARKTEPETPGKGRKGRSSPSVLGILAGAMVGFGGVSFACAAEIRDESDPRVWLRLETVLDGRCHNLSEGGKLVVMHNEHPSRTIRYRLLRVHVDRPQGLMDGIIAPGEPAQRLGCDKVGGRPQAWQIKRAQFDAE
ncbi:MAG: hypothetical protein FJ164_06850 [Gammaproteobacteria bacterium]|nr:hypothetical protein [Gammaproteobacteria bacterium]